MKLRFFAARDALVRERHTDGSHFATPVGQPVRYVGRAIVGALIPPATREPYECEAGTGEADYLVRECRDGDLFVADEETAKAIGLPLLDIELVNGRWDRKPPPAAPAQADSSAPMGSGVTTTTSTDAEASS